MNAQTVLVTGSSSGFGFELTQRLVREGYTVFATMRNLEGQNAETATHLRTYAQQHEGSVHLLDLDVQDEDSVHTAVKSVLRQVEKIDVVINNAGIGGGGYTEAFTPDQFQETFDVNVFGIQRMMRAVVPSMRARRSGLIINISSLQGRVVIPFAGAYTASKFAVEGLAETYHYELAPLGIDVVIVEPGGFLTGYWSKLMAPKDSERANGYAPDMNLPDNLWNGVITNLKSEQAPDMQILLSAIIQLIETPAGKRPLRTVVDPMMGGGAPTAVNQVSESVQRELLHTLGLDNRLSV